MAWRPVHLHTLQAQQTIRVNGQMAVRIHQVVCRHPGSIEIVTDQGQVLEVQASDTLLRLHRARADQPAPTSAAQDDPERDPSPSAQLSGRPAR